jgi:hypothetical protein
MANFTFTRVRNIMRRVIARRNATDSLSGDTELQEYIGEFVRDLMPQEVKNFENFDVYDFSTVANDFIYTFNTSNIAVLEGGTGQDESGQESPGDDEDGGNEFENIGPIAFSSDPNNLTNGGNAILMRWFQDPAIFYDKWGFIEAIADAQTGQPTDILFTNNRFELRPVPDGVYTIRIPGFRRNQDFTDLTSTTRIPENYWGRYIAYGASLDYMYDFGYDPSRIQVVESRYKHYKALVHNRTFNQFNQNTPIPRW